MRTTYNFSAGPGVLPEPVLKKAQAELYDYHGQGMSIMEMSHRSAVFEDIIQGAEANLRKLMHIPDNYHVLFVQGGASGQFAMVPLNLMNRNKKADYVNTGNWSQKAIAEGKRYGHVNVVASSEDDNFDHIPALRPDMFDPKADYVHITSNNTIYGTLFPRLPDTGDVPLVNDMSSHILSQEYRVEDFGLIYAGAQKNIGPAGVTIIIVREDLVGNAQGITPKMFNYKTYADKGSLFNTPPTFAIYMAGLVFDWMLDQGGVSYFEKRNQEKAKILYTYLDQSDFFEATISPPFRSLMNVPFRLPTAELDKQFLEEADAASLKTLKGHRSVGGMRASVYNAMPMEGVQALVDFMKDFERRMG